MKGKGKGGENGELGWVFAEECSEGVEEWEDEMRLRCGGWVE